MIALAVVGASYGDESKGAICDYLCATKGADVVVRYNGSANAGHTVCTPDGKRHVFRHIGSGSFVGVPTFLSQFFVLNPILFFQELDDLRALGVTPTVFAHPSCLVTTFADMLINQRKEAKRGSQRHGSCGVGVHETMQRSQVPELKITMADLWNGANLDSKLEQICGKWATFRTGSKIDEPAMVKAFKKGCQRFAEAIHPLGMGQVKDPVFEGAQGLLLDQDNKEHWPHVTHSNTGLRNVRILCAQAKIAKIVPYYVSRTYLTRHGAGKLPGEDPKMKFHDDTNVENPWQGKLRFAPLDYRALSARVLADAGEYAPRLVLTHCDQLAHQPGAVLHSYGPTRTDIIDHMENKRFAAS
jgi:adenylosuccinate synthase